MSTSRTDQLWKQYAGPRWSQRKARLIRAELQTAVEQAHAALSADAVSHGGRLAFACDDLLLAVLAGLVMACEYCGEYYGVGSWGVVRRNPLLNVQGSNVQRTDFSPRAYAVCCDRCADGHRRFTDDQWLGLLAQLRKCDDSVAREAIAALGKGTPPAPGGRG